MKKNKTYTMRVVGCLRAFLALALLTACIAEEQAGGAGGNDPKGNETRVKFSIVVPVKTQTLATRATPDESAVNRIQILLFEKVNGVKTYRYRVEVDAITTLSPSQKAFQATLPLGTYDIVVLANAKDILDAANPVFGSTKEETLGALVEKNTGKWENSAIPMWGQRNDQVINSQLSLTGSNAIRMIRMIAKIELEITPEAAGTNQEKFKWTDVRLYNYSSQGALSPDADTWPADQIAVTPTPPAGSDGYATMRYPAHAPLVFDTKVFYTYEAPAGGKGAMAANTCLVIGGSYKGGPTTYYRVDFVGKSNPDLFLPLLRNCHYVVRIVDVTGEGHSTPEKAFEATRSEMEVHVLGWNNGGVGDLVFDGQNTLEVSKNEFIFPNEALTAATAANALTVRTSVAGGWEIEKITDGSGTAGTAGWLTASDTAFASPNTSKDISLYVTENKTGAERTGYVYLRAGRLSFRVTVTQKTTFHLRITDSGGNEINELTYPLAGATKEFNVSWTPTTTKVAVTLTTIGDEAFNGTGAPANNASLTGGSMKYTVKATPYTGSNLLITRASKLDFTINDGTMIATRTILLRQFDYNLVFVNPVYFFMDGGEKKIGVRANTTWEVIGVSDPNNILTNKSEITGRTGGPNMSANGDALSFKIANRQSSPSGATPSAFFAIRSATGKQYNVEVKGFTAYMVDNLLVWPFDLPIGGSDNWFTFADVSNGSNSDAVPPAGPRNTVVNPRSCAALDASNKNLWRLPTRDEIFKVFGYFRSHGGYAKYGMANVDFDASYNGLANMDHGYWTATTAVNSANAMAYWAGYNVRNNAGYAGHFSKDTRGDTYTGTADGIYKTWHFHVRCVRSK